MALQNRFDALVGTRIERDGAVGGRLHSLARVLLGEPQNAEAGAVALFRVALAGHDAVEQFGGRRARGAAPSPPAGGPPTRGAADALGAGDGCRWWGGGPHGPARGGTRESRDG